MKDNEQPEQNLIGNDGFAFDENSTITPKDITIIELRQELADLKAFKEYTHNRLDDMGIPVDPESPHKAAGCRIGGRLDIVADLKQQAELKDREILALNQWKHHQILIWGEVIQHMSVHPELVVGDSISEHVLEFLKERDDLKQENERFAKLAHESNRLMCDLETAKQENTLGLKNLQFKNNRRGGRRDMTVIKWTPAKNPPPAKSGWKHSEQVLVWYVGTENHIEAYGVAYYHYDPPFEPARYVDFQRYNRQPDFWQPLPKPPNKSKP